ncbi:MAG: hypothetical protein ACXADA_14635 [Candidatus Hodarchaeales archaeon]|jgi:hypothetical protein
MSTVNPNSKLDPDQVTIKTIFFACFRLFGPVEFEKFNQAYLIPRGYEVSNTVLLYPPVRVLRGKKQLSLERISDKHIITAELQLTVDHGFCFARLELPIKLDELGSLEEELFAVPQLELDSISLVQLLINVNETIFNQKNIIFLEQSASLETEDFKRRCSELGIDAWQSGFGLNIESYLIMENQSASSWIEYNINGKNFPLLFLIGALVSFPCCQTDSMMKIFFLISNAGQHLTIHYSFKEIMNR